MTTPPDRLTAARVEALFTSPLATGPQPTRTKATAAIGHAIRAHRGSRGCAIALAGEYGEHPETAARRMRWARQTVETLYPSGSTRTRSAALILAPHHAKAA
jgi:hypothetical protein